MVQSRRFPIPAPSGSPTACIVNHASSITPRLPGATAAGRRPLSSALLYELHIGTFTPEGTFKAAESRLDYLKELGVTHVELMPIANFPGKRGWGYDGVDLYAPFSAYGEPDDLKRLVNACHGKGLAVVLDVVYNHLGPVGNYLGKFGPYFTTSHSTPWGDAVNFEEAGSTEVRRFLIDNALMWLRDYHMDGLRLDAVHAFNDRSAIHFLEQLMGDVRRLEAAIGKHLYIIAESDLNDPRIVKAEEAGDTVWTPNGATIFTTRCSRSFPANERAITRTSVCSPSWPSRCGVCLSTTASFLNIGSESTAARSSAFQGIASSGLFRITIRWAIGPRANASAMKLGWAARR